MKTIGLLGGMSWESSLEYYRIVNELVRGRLGGHSSAKCVMYSVDFAEIERFQNAGDWTEAAYVLAAAGQGVQAAGADCLVLCTNTMHKIAGEIISQISIPFIHIADPTAEKIKAAGIQKIGLLGTDFTMSQAFYKGRLVQEHGLDVLIPNEENRATVHRIIYEELVMGEIKPESKEAYIQIINELIADGAEGIILGCTEIGLLVQDGDCDKPLFDTTFLHAEAAVDFALND